MTMLYGIFRAFTAFTTTSEKETRWQLPVAGAAPVGASGWEPPPSRNPARRHCWRAGCWPLPWPCTGLEEAQATRRADSVPRYNKGRVLCIMEQHFRLAKCYQD